MPVAPTTTTRGGRGENDDIMMQRFVACSMGLEQALKGRWEEVEEAQRHGIWQSEYGNGSVSHLICQAAHVRYSILASFAIRANPPSDLTP